MWPIRQCLSIAICTTLASPHTFSGGTGAPLPSIREELRTTSPAETAGVTVVPFQLYHGFIIVQATVDGRNGNFIFDIGSPTIALNRRYVQKNSNGGLDTVTNDPGQVAQTPFTLHSIQFGATTISIATIDAGTPEPYLYNTYITVDPRFDISGGGPTLGFLGLPALANSEVIIDYRHRRLMLVPLDSTGQPLAKVPGYTSRQTLPLVPYDRHYWGVQVHLDGTSHLFMLDTGSPINLLREETSKALTAHLTPTTIKGVPRFYGTQTQWKDVQGWSLDHLLIGTQTVDTLSFIRASQDLLGSSFFQQIGGIIGFNFHTRQFLIFHSTRT